MTRVRTFLACLALLAGLVVAVPVTSPDAPGADGAIAAAQQGDVCTRTTPTGSNPRTRLSVTTSYVTTVYTCKSFFFVACSNGTQFSTHYTARNATAIREFTCPVGTSVVTAYTTRVL